MLLSIYAVMLIGAAVGLHMRGRRTRSAAERTETVYGESVTGEQAPTSGERFWPHSEIPKLHTGVAIVAAFAATILPMAAVIEYHQIPELIVLVTVSAGGCITFVLLSHSMWVHHHREAPRTTSGSQQPDPDAGVSTSQHRPPYPQS